VDILEKRGLKEDRLKHLGSGLRGASMSSTWRVMTMKNHALHFLLREVAPVDDILAQLE